MAEPTTYIVLRRVSTDTWQIVDQQTGSAAQAIRKAAGKRGGGDPPTPNQDGTYVAIPARSWKPVTVRAEQQVVLKLEDASA